MKRIVDTEMDDIPYVDIDSKQGQKRAMRERLTTSIEFNENPHQGSADLPIPPKRPFSLVVWVKELFNLYIKPNDGTRTIPLGVPKTVWSGNQFPSNTTNNRRYSAVTFLPLALLHQFCNFFNVFYLFLAFSQLVPELKVGFLFTYFSPLLMVVTLSLLKESVDEIKRYLRDRVANRETFDKLLTQGKVTPVKAESIQVGDLLLLHHNQRIPADCILLHTSEEGGTCFIRTDQLDGETDWKLRFPLNVTKSLSLAQIASLRMNVRCEPLHKDIYKFVGAVDTLSGQSEAISLENTLWSSCVVASGTLAALVIHTGRDTRMAMNSAKPATKKGLIESELNFIGVLCLILLIIMSFSLVVQQNFEGNWAIMFIRFFILLSAMIPISMRVNVDVGRLWYSHEIAKDNKIPGTIARNTDMPEELGRLQYLFCDKTGTLTKNKMEFRLLAVASNMQFNDRDSDRLRDLVNVYFDKSTQKTVTEGLQEVKAVGDAILALVLCHNVNPVLSEESGPHHECTVEYQASSPDEVALVKYCKELGVVLSSRDANSITFTHNGTSYKYKIIKLFPFTSERKSMGVIVEETNDQTGTTSYKYFMKGADTKMMTVIRPSDWLEECTQEVAQLGLRTLVFASRDVSEALLQRFIQEYDSACAVMGEARYQYIADALRLLETDMTLLGVTGVEDELQDNVVVTLETLGMCGIKVWILTGDKVETATTIGRSTRLIPRYGVLETVLCSSADECYTALMRLHSLYAPSLFGEFMATPWTLIIDGTTLSFCLSKALAPIFAEVARCAHSVIVARCSPTQKANVVKTMRRFSSSKVRMAAIGDGGNDVAMILAANVGIGIEGVEGKQASMAADFSMTQFSHCLRLIMWHGRNAYRRTCRLSQFIMHRGIVYSVVQAVFSLLFAGTTMSVFNGYLLMGYSTVFTMAPAFALVMDEDFKESDIHEYPQLYKELVKGRSMNTRTFLQWVWISFFQGGVMMYVSLEQFSDELFQIVTIAYTSLLISELIIVGSTAHLSTLWHQRRSHFWLYIGAELLSLVMFFVAVLVLPDTFDKAFFFSWSCWWRVFVICLASIGPLIVFRWIGKHIIFNRKLVSSFL
ncbi:phospholipid-translocating ATPase [Angomonas deanei]|nr:phospholipid-translocating ATPase [Angomonas deanei]|eukprot:EPY24603.1 phospholipid-translocating ATPase [Angomonas deanei]